MEKDEIPGIPNLKNKNQHKINALRIFLLIVVILSVWIFTLLSFNTRKTVNENNEKISPSPAPVKSRIVPGQIIVKFKDGISDEEINRDLAKYNSRIKTRIEGIGDLVIEVPAGQEEKILKELSKDPLVKYSEPDRIRKINFTPNDPSFGSQWALSNTGKMINGKQCTSGSDIKAASAWDVTKGDGIKVAVVDTGVNLSHPDLVSKIAGSKIFNTTTIEDNYGHGTHVAGIIAASGNNSQGGSGVCPGCQLLIAKSMDDSGQGPTSGIASAITWAADNGAKVINISAGGLDQSQSELSAIDYAWSKGAVVVAATGNDNSDALFYPAAYNNVLSVAASDCTDIKADFSNYGTWVNVAAPGEDIYSTFPTHSFNMQQETAGLTINYGSISGTSMASPFVSGLAGLVWSTSAGTSPGSVSQRIKETADKIAGTGTYWGAGRINAQKAVGQPLSPTVAPTVIPTIVPTQVSPTWYCGGAGTNCVPSVSPIPTEVQPSSIPPSPDPTFAQTTVVPTVDPCSDTVNEVQATKNREHPKKKTGYIGMLMQYLFKILEAIISLLFKGGGEINPSPSVYPTIPVPMDPSPTIDPCL